MKMDWGKGIALSFVIFAILLAFLVYKTGEVTSEMVTDNYYEKELEYNAQYDARKNVLGLSEKPVIELTSTELVITYPAEAISENTRGEVYFYSINNVSKDKLYTIKTDTLNRQTFGKEILTSGNYNIQLKWATDSVEYLFDKNIFIP